jgi:hypothetical protein
MEGDHVLTEEIDGLCLSDGSGLRPDDHPMSIMILIGVGVPVVTERDLVPAESNFELRSIPQNRNLVV